MLYPAWPFLTISTTSEILNLFMVFYNESDVNLSPISPWQPLCQSCFSAELSAFTRSLLGDQCGSFGGEIGGLRLQELCCRERYMFYSTNASSAENRLINELLTIDQNRMAYKTVVGLDREPIWNEKKTEVV